jgi:cell division topological specificity factor
VGIFDYFRSSKTNTASLAKERLQVIVAHERNQRNQPDYLPKMQQEIINVIKKYIPIDNDQVTVNLENSDSCSILELNVTLPDREK